MAFQAVIAVPVPPKEIVNRACWDVETPGHTVCGPNLLSAAHFPKAETNKPEFLSSVKSAIQTSSAQLLARDFYSHCLCRLTSAQIINKLLDRS